ncbi:LacI family DNA-binding transcriptional regulator [Propionibacterium freudenreichii]|uniref:LacI family DNA-binding transcriptional regulator n=1 Tax=Propionibacterium freudenreichii TaxID=1744 RepID=UPI0022FD3CE4|nr:LacI family DNA-binding transcriptional regulator [Propionibacterium freudenreichii]
MSGSSMGRRPTMRDVARAAGVSQSLVSIVFRGAPGAGAQTRDRVLAAARELGYVRDESARSLRASQSTSIGVCFQTRQPFHHVLLDGMYAHTAGTNHPLVLSAVSDARDEATAIRGLLAYRCGALVLLGPRGDEQSLAAMAGDTPVVVVGRRVDDRSIDWVTSDDGLGMDQAVTHLRTLGHRRVLYLSCSRAAGGPDRLQAFHDAAAANGISRSVTVADGEMTEQRGARAAERLLVGSILPTAVIAFNDRVALGLMEVLIRRGVAVPKDISVVGFDDSEIAQRDPVLMTSVHQDAESLARIAVERASQRIHPSSPPTDPHGTLVPTHLVVRSTTGEAPRR